jgi:transcription elongation factor GreA
MANGKEVYLTTDGLEELKKELDYLKTTRRPEVIDALRDARALGDLSENAEYDAAREAQREVEGKIVQLEAMIENAIVIEETKKDKVSIGCSVKIKYTEDDEIDEYAIVGSQEADPFMNKISNESPIAKAIMGKKKKDKVTVASPNGDYEIEIVDIF